MVATGDTVAGLEQLEFRHNGDRVNLGELRGDGPLVLVFLRHFG